MVYADKRKIILILSWVAFLVTVTVAAYEIWRMRIERIESICRQEEEMMQIREAAHKIVDMIKSDNPETHEFKLTSPEEFLGRDKTFYDNMQKQFGERGYSFVADVEDVTLNASHPDLKTFVRILLSKDSKTILGIYDVTPPDEQLENMPEDWRDSFKTYDFETELKDGSFVLSTTSRIPAFREPPEIMKYIVENPMDVDNACDAHYRSVQDVCLKRNTDCIIHVDYDDILASFGRGSKIKHNYWRRKNFCPDDKELVIFEQQFTKSLMDEVRKEIGRMRKTGGQQKE